MAQRRARAAVIEPIKIITLGPCVHHLTFVLKHKQAAGCFSVIIGAIAFCAETKEMFCPSV